MAIKKEKKKVKYRYLSILLLFISIIFLIIINVLNILPIKYLFFEFLLFLFELFLVYKLNHKTFVITKMIATFISIILIIIQVIIIVYLFNTFDFINVIFDKGNDYDKYGVYVINNEYQEINDLNNKNILIHKDERLEEIKKELDTKIKYKSKQESDVKDLLNVLKDNKYDAIIIKDNLFDLYGEIDTDLKKIYTIKIKIKKDTSYKEVNVKKEAFAIYISGIDSKGSISELSRSDVNILGIVNPIKKDILVINTPRDYYVELYSKKKMDKITHAGIYGIGESAKTLGNLYDIDVNYYIRFNFSSFLNIIDEIGGITVDVEKPDYRYNLDIDCGKGYVCEQNSDREFGDKLIKFKYGLQTLNAEEALAYARNRHQYAASDNARQYHQQQVIKAVLEKLQDKKMILKYNRLLKVLSSGVKTNIDQKTISNLINMQLRNNDSWNINMMVAKGTDAYNVCYSTGNLKGYVMEPDIESVNEIKNKIKEVMTN